MNTTVKHKFLFMNLNKGVGKTSNIYHLYMDEEKNCDTLITV